MSPYEVDIITPADFIEMLRVCILTVDQVLDFFSKLKEGTTDANIKKIYDAISKFQDYTDEEYSRISHELNGFVVNTKKNWKVLFKKLPKENMQKYVNQKQIFESDVFNTWR